MYWTFSIKSVYITSLSEKPYKVLIYCHPNHLQILAYYLPSILLPSGKTTIYQAGFKLNIQKAKIMAPGPITSWQIDGETIETVTDLFSWAPKSLQIVTAAMKLTDTCSLEEKLWPT